MDITERLDECRELLGKAHAGLVCANGLLKDMKRLFEIPFTPMKQMKIPEGCEAINEVFVTIEAAKEEIERLRREAENG